MGIIKDLEKDFGRYTNVSDTLLRILLYKSYKSSTQKKKKIKYIYIYTHASESTFKHENFFF